MLARCEKQSSEQKEIRRVFYNLPLHVRKWIFAKSRHSTQQFQFRIMTWTSVTFVRLLWHNMSIIEIVLINMWPMKKDGNVFFGNSVWQFWACGDIYDTRWSFKDGQFSKNWPSSEITVVHEAEEGRLSLCFGNDKNKFWTYKILGNYEQKRGKKKPASKVLITTPKRKLFSRQDPCRVPKFQSPY